MPSSPRSAGTEEQNLQQVIAAFQRAFDIQSTGRYREAAQEFGRTIELARKTMGERSKLFRMLLSSAVTCYIQAGDLSQAQKTVDELEVCVRPLGEKHAEYAGYLQTRSMLFLATARKVEAVAVLRQACDIQKAVSGPESLEYAQVLYSLATAVDMLGQTAESIRLLLTAVPILRAGGPPAAPTYGNCLSVLAAAHRDAGNLREAEATVGELLTSTRKQVGEQHPEYAFSLLEAAGLFRDTANFAAAERAYRDAVAIYQAAGDVGERYLSALSGLANLYEQSADYDKAEQELLRACRVVEMHGSKRSAKYRNFQRSLLSVYARLGRDAQATALARELVPHFEEMDPVELIASIAACLYAAQTLGGQVDFSGLIGQAIGAIEREPQRARQFTIELSLLKASLATHQGDHKEAFNALQPAVDGTVSRYGKEHPAYAELLGSQAASLIRQGRLGEAEPLLLEAARIQVRAYGPLHPKHASALVSLAALQVKSGRAVEAMHSLNRALSCGDEALRRVFSYSSEADMAEYLGQVPSIDLFLSLMPSVREEPGTAHATALQWVLRRKGVIFDATSRFQEARRLRGTDPSVADRADRLRYLRQEAAQVALAPTQPGDAEVAAKRADEILRLERDLNRLLSQGSVTWDPAEARVDTVARKIPPRSVLVEFYRATRFDYAAAGELVRPSAPHYWAFILKAGSPPAVEAVDLGEASVIEDRITDVVDSFRDTSRAAAGAGTDQARETELEQEYLETARELSERILRPLQPALAGVTRLYVAPDGELNRIPFEALVDERGRYLAETHQVSYLTSGAELLRPLSAPGKASLILGAPDFDLDTAVRQADADSPVRRPGETARLRGEPAVRLRGVKWDALPGAAAEAREVATLLEGSRFGPVQSFVGTAALEERLRNAKSPRILHIATHGFFLPFSGRNEPARPAAAGLGAGAGLGRLRGQDNPMLRSGFVLAGANQLGNRENPDVEDGWVTAEEVAQLDLKGTELVVLSACESGLGDVRTGQGVLGLRRAFQYAGARTLVTSLFKVPDLQTRELMQRFYGGLKAGKSKLTALHEARLDILRQRRKAQGVAHPFFWAGFILVGDSA